MHLRRESHSHLGYSLSLRVSASISVCLTACFASAMTDLSIQTVMANSTTWTRTSFVSSSIGVTNRGHLRSTVAYKQAALNTIAYLMKVSISSRLVLRIEVHNSFSRLDTVSRHVPSLIEHRLTNVRVVSS